MIEGEQKCPQGSHLLWWKPFSAREGGQKTQQDCAPEPWCGWKTWEEPELEAKGGCYPILDGTSPAFLRIPELFPHLQSCHWFQRWGNLQSSTFKCQDSGDQKLMLSRLFFCLKKLKALGLRSPWSRPRSLERCGASISPRTNSPIMPSTFCLVFKGDALYS